MTSVYEPTTDVETPADGSTVETVPETTPEMPAPATAAQVQSLNNQIFALERQIQQLGARGQDIPAHLTAQLTRINEAVERMSNEQATRDMTPEEAAAHWRKVATDKRTETTAPESTPEPAQVQAVAYSWLDADGYEDVSDYAEALGLGMTPDAWRILRDDGSAPTVYVDRGGNVDGREWVKWARAQVKAVATAQQAEPKPAAPARNLGDGSRPAATARTKDIPWWEPGGLESAIAGAKAVGQWETKG